MGSGQERHEAAAGTGPPTAGAQARLLKVAEAVQRELARKQEREIYERLLGRVRKFIRLKVSDSDAIDTIAQETLLVALLHEQAGKPVHDAYALGIARRRIAAYYRRKRDVLEQPGREIDYDAKLDSAHLANAIAAETAVDRERVLAKVEELPPFEKAVYSMYSSDMSPAEIAELLEVDVQQVYYRLRRANELLAKSLGLPPRKECI